MNIVAVNVKSSRSVYVALAVVCKAFSCPSLQPDSDLCLRKEWLQYASWEASQNEFARARSVFERALDVDPRSVPLWLTYTETELKSRNVQHARNLFDRAVTLLPRVDQLWYKYVYLEELLQNIAGARQVFERWMAWEPDDKAWQAYIKLETRYNELDRASAVYERWVAVRPEPRVWVKWGKFEEERGKVDKARDVFKTALEFFGDEEEQVEKAQAVFGAFAKMETRLKEYERARVIYKVGSHLPPFLGCGFFKFASVVCIGAPSTLKIRQLVCCVHKI
jgi:crooked neck